MTSQRFKFKWMMLTCLVTLATLLHVGCGDATQPTGDASATTEFSPDDGEYSGSASPGVATFEDSMPVGEMDMEESDAPAENYANGQLITRGGQDGSAQSGQKAELPVPVNESITTLDESKDLEKKSDVGDSRESAPMSISGVAPADESLTRNRPGTAQKSGGLGSGAFGGGRGRTELASEAEGLAQQQKQLGGRRGTSDKSGLSLASELAPAGSGEPNATPNRRQLNGRPDQGRRPLTVDLLPGEELWVIARAVDTTTAPPDNPARPGCGALMAKLPNEPTQVPVPLKHTSVEGHVDGFIASVDVTQQFHNPYDSKIEAVYVFPLPQNAAVNEFVMTVGDRKIRGIIREREKAEQIYRDARAQGHVASLLTQERPNIFTQKVANIEPGKQIDINIRYFNTLQYDDGAYEFVFPMVVGPRFNPPATTDGIAAVPRGHQGTNGQATAVQYLAPNERSGHDISLKLNIDAGVDIEDIHCVNHAIEDSVVSTCQRTVELSSGDSIPNKDFVLRYRVAGEQIKTAMMTHEDEHGKYFTMMVYPPAELSSVQRSPMEMVFVLDCSGSMRGKPLTQAKAAVRHALHSLTPRDTFQIIRFSNNASQLGSEPVLATEENIQKGLEYLASLNGSGGTHMIEGIKTALDFPHDKGRYRLVSFMTDGFIGNEQQILTTLHQKLGASRVFSFGVGSSPNRFLMDRMAIVGRGAVAYLSLEDNAVDVMSRFNDRISHPAMTDLAIDWGEMNVTDVYPQHVPDLIVGRPVTITGRFDGKIDTVKINGRVCMEPTSFDITLDGEATDEHAGIAAVWARMKIKDLMLQSAKAPEEAAQFKQLVTQTALNYNLMSSFTAFVAVDSMSKTEGEFGTTVAVPVPVPDGVRYDTTVGGNSD